MPDTRQPPHDVPPHEAFAGDPGLRAGSPNAHTSKLSTNNLPLELTSFIGREREITEVKGLVSKTRLLTLTGPGGCGKTRLALAVAAEVVEDFENGVWWVELASLSDPTLVPQAVASALKVREAPGRSLTEVLVAHLESKKTLLVLDNCEHLVASCAALADTLLRACPELQILATSREALGIAGEMYWLVPSLSLPDPERLPPTENMTRYEAVRLFVERAADSRFELTQKNTPAMARLCQRLDGIPLAIELAAARVKVLSIEQIASRLDDCFRLLADGSRAALPRHRTLRATIDWSHDLLSENEQVLFRRLAVFAGGFTLEAAEAVCTGEDLEENEVLSLLSHLVDKSLVLVSEQQGGEARYRLLETVRQYASEKLRASGEAEATQRRHASFFLRLAETAEPALLGREQASWMDRLEQEHDNLRRALDWSMEEVDGTGLGLRLAGALSRFWWIRGHLTEGRARLETLLALPPAARSAARAKALYALGVLVFRHADYAAGDHAVARARFEESLVISRELKDRPGVAAALRELGRVDVELGDHASARPLLQESLLLERELGDRHAIALSLSSLGWQMLFQGDHTAARPLLEEGLEIFEECEDALYVGICSYFLGHLAIEQGDYTTARSRFAAILERVPMFQYRWGLPFVLEGFARLAAAQGWAAQALRLAGAATALRETINASAGPAWQDDLQRRLEPAREALGREAATAAWAEGRAMTPEMAVAYALESAPETMAVPPATQPVGLTVRETEVLRLVSKGMTDAQVAKELFISPRTVNAHVRSIYSKLGVSSRAAATRFAIDHNLV